MDVNTYYSGPADQLICAEQQIECASLLVYVTYLNRALSVMTHQVAEMRRDIDEIAANNMNMMAI